MAVLEFDIMKPEFKSVSATSMGIFQEGNIPGRDLSYVTTMEASSENDPTPETGATVSSPRKALSSLAVVDSRSLFRECIVTFFANYRNLTATGFSSVDDLLSRKHSIKFSLLVLFSVTESRQTTLQDVTRLKEAQPDCTIVILIDTSDNQFMKELLKHGVRGIIPTEFPSNVVYEAINLVLAGGIFVPADNLLAERQHSVQRNNVQRAAVHATGLTQREGQIVGLLRAGKSNKLIAYELGLSIGTVKVHMHNIMIKLGAHNRVQLLVNDGML
jgi:DNA-binding NarL/FixJ family response regulator